jgi:hypothetical protein
VPAWHRHGAQSVAWAGARHTKPQAEAEAEISYILSYNVRLRHKGREKEEEIQLITEDEKAEQLGCGGCTGNCATCSGCSDQQALESIEKGDLLIINKKTGLISIAKPNMLDDLDIDDYEFYELSPVFVEKVVSYKITHL